jgi:dTDP-4-dehydrorhamnose 3,5-epimerase-like enzyme
MWICLKGSFKVGLIQDRVDQDDVTWEYLSDKNFRCLVIPPGTFHGYKALEPGSILMYYTTCKYDPENPDEIRKDVGDFDECWETPNR